MSSITIRRAVEADGEAITRLFQKVFNKEMTPAQWRWKYRPDGWQPLCGVVAEAGPGDIVGHIGAVPGSNKPVWQLADAMVTAEYRGRNLFSDMLREVGRLTDAVSDDALCYAFAGPDSTRLGISREILFDKLQVLSYLPDPAYPLPGLLGWSLERTSFSDDRLERLWKKYSSCLAVFADRDSRYIHWRYASNPFHSYQAGIVKFLLRPVGWLIWSEDDSGIRLVDFCTDRKHMDKVLALGARLGADRGNVTFWLSYARLKDFRMRLIPEQTPIHLMLLNHRKGGQTRERLKKEYYFTMGDVDIY